jgi:hypothetical protein
VFLVLYSTLHASASNEENHVHKFWKALVVKMLIVVLWVVTLYNVVGGYHPFSEFLHSVGNTYSTT